MRKQTVIASLLMLSVLVTACSGTSPFATPTPTPTCLEASSDYIGAVEKLFDEFLDGAELADATARIQLTDPVANLQAVRRRANDLQPPGCAGHIQTALVACMDHRIDAYLAFMAEESDNVVETALRNSNRRCDDMLQAIADLD